MLFANQTRPTHAALAVAQSRLAALRRSGQFALSQYIDRDPPSIDLLAALSGQTPRGRRGDLR
jgi:hypothetical protein